MKTTGIWPIFWSTFLGLSGIHFFLVWLIEDPELPAFPSVKTLIVWFHLIAIETIICVLSWQLAQVICRRLDPSKVDPTDKVVLVTGCDSGFGHLLAKKLDSIGFRVVAGVLQPDGAGANSLLEKCSNRLQVMKMDVTRPEDVDKVIDSIASSGRGLWAVVNNAGVAHSAPIELGHDIDDCRALFDVNVFGVVRVAKKCLPLLRQTRGRVINVASTAGRFSVPGLTSYCMSKHAVRSFSDGLRREVSFQGVNVIVIEPHLYRTPIVDLDAGRRYLDKMEAATDDQVKRAYGKNHVKKFEMFAATARPYVDEVIDAMADAVASKRPNIFYRVTGPSEKPVLWFLEFLSEEAIDWIIAVMTNVKLAGALIQGYNVMHWLITFRWLRGSSKRKVK